MVSCSILATRSMVMSMTSLSAGSSAAAMRSVSGIIGGGALVSLPVLRRIDRRSVSVGIELSQVRRGASALRSR